MLITRRNLWQDYVKRMKKVVDEIEDKIEKQKYRLEKPPQISVIKSTLHVTLLIY